MARDEEAWRERVEVLERELEAARQEAAEQRSRAEALEHTPSAVALALPDGELLYVNRAFLELWGYDAAEEVTGRRAEDFMWSQDQLRRGASTLAENAQLICQFEAIRKDRRCFEVEMRVLPVRGEDGRLVLLQAFFQDITARKRLERELIESRNDASLAHGAKRMFLANVSHELRTPMNGILGFASLLKDVQLPSEASEYAAILHDSARSLMNVIGNILDVSNIESGQLIIEQRPFQLDDCIQDALDYLAVAARKKGLHMRSEIAAGTPVLLVGDGGRLRQILINLLGNAVKFTDEGEVVVSAECHQREDGRLELSISVRDTGIGIPPEMVDRIMRPFQQVDTSYARQYGGMGLGLYITRELCERMGGTLTVKTTPGKGATFSFGILINRAHEVVHRHHAPSTFRMAEWERRESSGKPAILLVEDEPSNQGLVKKYLERFGFSCDVAENGMQALEAIRLQPYDLVIMDVQMPLMDGLEATRRIYAEDLRSHARYIVALTAHALQSDEKACRAAGMDDYLAKPLSPDQLKGLLVRLFEKRIF